MVLIRYFCQLEILAWCINKDINPDTIVVQGFILKCISVSCWPICHNPCATLPADQTKLIVLEEWTHGHDGATLSYWKYWHFHKHVDIELLIKYRDGDFSFSHSKKFLQESTPDHLSRFFLHFNLPLSISSCRVSLHGHPHHPTALRIMAIRLSTPILIECYFAGFHRPGIFPIIW